ncbi:MAG: hypothetical protein ABI321_23330 [Polyangia bacterium]
MTWLWCAAAHALPLDLSAELVIDGAASAHQRRVPVTLTPSDCGGKACWKALVRDADLAVTVTVEAGTRTFPWSVEAEALRAQAVRQVTLNVRVAADSFIALGRDYRPDRASHVLLDRFDPKWVTLLRKGEPVGAVLADDNLDTLEVSREHGVVQLGIELMSVLARPFGHLPRCGHQWRDVKGRVLVGERYLATGDRLEASGELVLGAVSTVALSPWPEGRDAAFVITDHADQTSSDTLHALLGGSATADLDHPSRGLLGHHVPITKALFLHGTAHHGFLSSEADEAEVQRLADRMRLNGSELAPHSATPLPDSRAVVDEALVKFSAEGATVWIDHQPQTNCEGFDQTGWHTGTGISDLLEKRKFTDVWDLSEWAGEGLDERDPRHLDRRAATVWPLGRLEPRGPGSLWMFRSTWAFLPMRAFYQRYSEAAIDQLEHDRGLHIAHTYLETLHPRGTFFGRRNLELRDENGQPALDPRFDAVLASLDRRRARGTLWLVPIGALANRLRALRRVKLRIDDEGKLSVTSPPDVDALTLQLGAIVPLDGTAGQRLANPGVRVWWPECPGTSSSQETCTRTVARGLLR